MKNACDGAFHATQKSVVDEIFLETITFIIFVFSLSLCEISGIWAKSDDTYDL